MPPTGLPRDSGEQGCVEGFIARSCLWVHMDEHVSFRTHLSPGEGGGGGGAYRLRIAANCICLPCRVCSGGISLVEAGLALGVEAGNEGRYAEWPHSSALSVLLLHTCTRQSFYRYMGYPTGQRHTSDHSQRRSPCYMNTDLEQLHGAALNSGPAYFAQYVRQITNILLEAPLSFAHIDTPALYLQYSRGCLRQLRAHRGSGGSSATPQGLCQ